MRDLWPPIEVIASSLQNGNVVPLHFPDKEDINAADHVDTASAAMPVFIRHKISKRVASRMAQFDTQPKAGQVWRFDGKQDNTAPLCVLLERQQDQNYWQGWLVAAETDYATHQDVLLEPKDEPFDPVAGMVQTWNPVCVDIRKGSRVLAQLAPHRIDAIREVANGQCEWDSAARPGFIAPLKTRTGATILAGTCITHPADQRRRYQSLYRTAAGALEQEQSPIQRNAQIISLSERGPRKWHNVRWALAASIVLVQAAIIANLMRSQPDMSIEEQFNRASEYRAVPHQPASYAYLDVNFKPGAKEVDIRKLLAMLNASIVDGPGEYGQYRVKIQIGSVQETVNKMKASGLVDSAVRQ